MRAFSLITVIALSLTGCSAKTNQPFDQLPLNMSQGRWLIINYWASWCKPCLEEMPALNQFASRHHENVDVYAVNFDGIQGDALLTESQKLNIQLNLVNQDPAQQLGYPRPTALPTTLVFNPAGQLQHTLIGPQTEQSLAQAIKPIAY